MLFVELTNAGSHHPVVVNMDHVAHYMDMVDNDLEVKGVQIRMKFGDILHVTETVAQINEKVQNGNQRG